MFQTYLENYEEGFGEWTKDHKKSYTNLSGGKYVFHVRAKDSNENVSEETTYTFFVEYPWYQTSWGIALIVILSISFIGSVTFQYTRIKTKRIEAEKKVLEDKVTERTQELELSNQEIISQKNNLEVKNKEIDHKNKEITQSIEYALHIQQSILPDTAAIYKVLTDSFVLYKPKDIVSGDFFAFTTISQAGQQDEIIIAAADCTGHGVPGALMSMLGSNILYQIVNEKKQTTPSDILYHLNVGVNESLKQNINEGNDGMDIVLCNIKYSNDFDSAEVQYAGANRPLYIVRDGMLEEIKATKMPIGGVQFQERIFTNHQMTLKKGDILFLTTDGYADQFGGELGKKLTTKKFKEFIVTLQDKPMKEQGKRVESFFDSWRGDNEQIDVVCFIGIRI
jgi:serine phosphatase RsbU (regulator of sigma subunit)